jgi:diketogulonate reductase-like aldo/keto reductase
MLMSPLPQVSHRGVNVPTFLYGTAWKEDDTERLTELALSCGFLGIDTANQRRHYHEAGVGFALKRIFSERKLRRENVFLQTKFTFAASQDHRLPYDPSVNYANQVRQSLHSSLEHLYTDYLDAFILHGPFNHRGLAEPDYEAWMAMEAMQQAGYVHLLGVSNVDLEQLSLFYEAARIKPAFVQNRCYASTRWDSEIREFCRQHDIIYQGFSLLTANSIELKHPAFSAIVQTHQCTAAQTVFRFALQTGIIPLTGTSRQNHMREALDAYRLELSESEHTTIENIAFL